MSLFCKENLSVYHIHIPRTGGRFITQTLVHNNYEVLHCRDDLLLYGIECFHLHYPLYEYLEGVNESIQFAIIRNPIDKFKSEFSNIFVKRGYTEDDMIDLEDYDSFCNFINLERMTHHYAKNWFRPQHEFINPKSLLWRFEDGLTNSFRTWFYDLTGDELDDKEYSYWGDEETELNPKRKQIILSNKIKNNIKEYYKEDYNIFGY